MSSRALASAPLAVHALGVPARTPAISPCHGSTAGQGTSTMSCALPVSTYLRAPQLSAPVMAALQGSWVQACMRKMAGQQLAQRQRCFSCTCAKPGGSQYQQQTS